MRLDNKITVTVQQVGTTPKGDRVITAATRTITHAEIKATRGHAIREAAGAAMIDLAAQLERNGGCS